MNQLELISSRLEAAAQLREAIGPISAEFPGLTMEDAYQIQLRGVEEKLARGRVIVGKKIGLTSLAMQELLGVDQPDYGVLLDDMVVTGGRLRRDSLVQPRVEAEIAFVLREDLTGPDVTAADVLAATDYVTAAFEIVDSRIRDWKIGLVDTVADNASSGAFVLSERRVKLDGVDLKTISMSLYRNGTLVNQGVGAAALGDPAYCVAWLANKMGSYGMPLRRGEVILSGALSAMAPVEAGDVFRAEFSVLGPVEVTFE